MLRNGFCVLVDFHPVSQVPKYAPEKLVQAEDDPLFIAYAGVIGRTAHLLATLHTNRVALEVMNEPQYGWDPATTVRWQRLLEHLHREARAEAPDLLLVLTGARGGDIKGLLALNPEPFKRSRVLYSFHYYEPHDFTHQLIDNAERLTMALHQRPAVSCPKRRSGSRLAENPTKYSERPKHCAA